MPSQILGIASIIFGVLVLALPGFLRLLIGIYFILAGVVILFL